MASSQHQDNPKQPEGNAKPRFRLRLKRPQGLVFFLALYVYLALGLEVGLLYHGSGLIGNFPVFYLDWHFAQSFLTYPGGIIQYVSAFLAQLFYTSWGGASVVTVLAWLFSLCIDQILKALDCRSWRIVRFVPGLILLVMFSQYTFLLDMPMACVVAIACTALYVKVPVANKALRLAVFLALACLVHITSGGAVLLFAALCGISECLLRYQWLMGLAQLAIGSAVPYAFGQWVYHVRLFDAYFECLPFSWKYKGIIGANLGYGLFGFLPGLLILLALLRPLTKKHVKPSSALSFWSTSRGDFGWNVSTLLLIAASAGASLYFRDVNLKALFKIDYCLYHQRWSEVLSLSQEKPYNYLVSHAIDRALYKSGQLANTLFHYPQSANAPLLTGKEALWQKIDTYIDLGLVNEAENAATICIETYGERPILLQRLARINMIKGNMDAACVYWHALAKVPFWRAQARNALAQIAEDPQCLEDDSIQKIRSRCLQMDTVHNMDFVQQLLNETPGNRMAYDYKMTELLLDRNLNEFMTLFQACHALNYTTIPRHFQEAIFLYRSLNKQIPDEDISTDVQRQLANFVKDLKRFGQNKAQARASLKESYGNSYLYYFFLGSSGAS